MSYNGFAWPGLSQPISRLVAARGKHARTLALVKESPKLFNRPTNVRRRCEEAIAQFDTALKVLRDVQKAAEAPPKRARGRRLNELDPGPARSDSGA